MAEQIVNLTPHEVRVIGWGDDIVYPASGKLARLATITLGTHRYEGVEAPVELVEFHHLTEDPPKVEGTWYIVSLPVALVAPRADFLVPYDEVRDDNGRIIGCRLLARPV